MALPKIDVPTYDLELPISKKKLKYRPFLVKEQKNLLMAMESDDNDSIQSNIKQVLQNCTITKKVDVDKLPLIDIEYYFLQLRARSVGEIVTNRYRCNNTVEDKECGNIMETDINILDIKVEGNISDEPIALTDKISVKLKYPEFSIVKKISGKDSMTDASFDMIANAIDYIFDGDQIYYAKESTHEELIEFLESLNQNQFSKLEEFFENLPKLQKTVKLKCSRCGFDHTIKAEGLEGFFG